MISNAAKYCEHKKPSLAISVRTDGNQLTMDFVDNGIGVARESQDDIFEKFSRVSDRAVGAGLGLAICREIMTNLGGTITYLPGQGGAAFRVSLPAAPIK